MISNCHLVPITDCVKQTEVCLFPLLPQKDTDRETDRQTQQAGRQVHREVYSKQRTLSKYIGEIRTNVLTGNKLAFFYHDAASVSIGIERKKIVTIF